MKKISKILILTCSVVLLANFLGCYKKSVRRDKPTYTKPVSIAEPSIRKKTFISSNDIIYFEFDSTTLNLAAKKALKNIAEQLKNNQDFELLIEGHCDNRGASEYNLGLGQRRATIVRQYLIKLDVSGNKIATISYGEERPVANGNNEQAWNKNRRVEIKQKR